MHKILAVSVVVVWVSVLFFFSFFLFFFSFFFSPPKSPVAWWVDVIIVNYFFQVVRPQRWRKVKCLPSRRLAPLGVASSTTTWNAPTTWRTLRWATYPSDCRDPRACSASSTRTSAHSLFAGGGWIGKGVSACVMCVIVVVYYPHAQAWQCKTIVFFFIVWILYS